MKKKTNYNKRLFGYTLLMLGLSHIPSIATYYHGFNINITFVTTVTLIIVGFMVMFYYPD